MKLIPKPSPNYDSRRDHGVSILVLHYTGMKTADEALGRLTDASSKVSAHYTIDEAGQVYAHVAEDQRAWHAGASSWRGITDVNSASIGIELVNPGHEFGYRPFAEMQMMALIDLCHGILSRHKIPARNVVGHSDVAPARKADPGELFDWQRLALAGIGVPVLCVKTSASGESLQIGDSGQAVADYRLALSTYGYGLDQGDDFDENARLVTQAFQRHFRPQRIDGVADIETQQILRTLLDLHL